MPKFQALNPNDVVLGRGRANALAVRPYVDAILAGDAGRIELDDGDDGAAVKRLLRKASKQAGIKVRSSWEDNSKRVLLWKRVGK